MTQNGEPSVSVSIDRKLNLGNYESVGLFVALSGVPVGASDELIDEMLDTGRKVYDKLRVRLGDLVTEERQKGSNL